MKQLLLVLLFTSVLFSQGYYYSKATVAGAANFIPDVIYADTAITKNDGTVSSVLTFTHYGSIQANQLMTVWLIKDRSGTSEQWQTGAISESGWTRAFQVTNTTTHDNAIAMFWKLAIGTESGDFTATATESDEQSGFYIVFDSVYTASPINYIGDTVSIGTNTTSITLDTATSSVNNCLAVAWTGVRNAQNFGDGVDTMRVTGTGWSLSPTAGISSGLVTNRINVNTDGGMMAMKDIWTAGTTGQPTFHWGYQGTTQYGAIGRIVLIRGNN